MKDGRLIAAAWALLLGAAASAAQAQEDSREGDWRGAMRSAMERWVETEKLISAERADWAVGREILQDRIAVLTNETAALVAATAGLDADYAAASGRLGDLVAEQEALKTLADALAADVAKAEARVLAILKRAPTPIRDKVRPLSQRIPERPGESKAGLGERLQNVVGVLNEVNKFARDVAIASEVMTPAGGESFEATVIYFGLGQAYYVNPLGTAAGRGAATPEGWVWMPSNAIARAVADVIAIHRNEKPAAYVTLPIAIQ
jgi:hypothetical protein